MNGFILKVLKCIPIIFSLSFSLSSFGQNHRYDRYDGPLSMSLGLKSLIIGGIIWGIGMLIILTHKKNEKGVVTSNAWTAKLGGTFAVIGMLLAGFGLIMLGF